MASPKPSVQQAELLRVLTAIAKRRIKKELQTMSSEEIDRLWDNLPVNLSEKESKA